MVEYRLENGICEVQTDGHWFDSSCSRLSHLLNEIKVAMDTLVDIGNSSNAEKLRWDP